ncbi:38281_t:CDS:2 [Gigaspora margarita]|uniref:38281_t:CDS:1 n=1 Tax=Gigaspora margarita TaxID=4874 RepID=A0ABM8VYL8_GIGMA|nr:38281_t:CDS:2 [Gigaspora margarita]
MCSKNKLSKLEFDNLVLNLINKYFVDKFLAKEEKEAIQKPLKESAIEKKSEFTKNRKIDIKAKSYKASDYF